MARHLNFAPRYLRDARRLRLRGDVAQGVRRALHFLEHAPALPGPGDAFKLIDDPDDPAALPKLANAHRVPGGNLWVWYWPSDTLVYVPALTDEPP